MRNASHEHDSGPISAAITGRKDVARTTNGADNDDSIGNVATTPRPQNDTRTLFT